MPVAPQKILVRITTVPISLEKLLSGQLRFMNSHYRVIGISSEEGGLDKVRRNEAIETHLVKMTRRITPFRDMLTVIQLYFYFRKTKPFIVHTHTPKAGIVGMLAAKLAGVKNRLHTVAGLPLLEESGSKRKLLDFVEKLTYYCANHVYPNSHGLYDIILKNNYCRPEKVKVLANGSSNGIDTAYFSRGHFSKESSSELKASLGITDDDRVFVFVGRLVKDKGINELVLAFSQLQQTHPNIKLLLVGDFESELDPLSEETMESIIDNRHIINTGWQNDVRPYFAISDFLAFPTYREGFPNVVMQAGAMELPCIVTDINGCNEIIVEGENGLIIPTKNKEAVYNAMRRMLEDKALAASMKQNARPMIVSRYEQHLVWEAILAEYRKFEN